MGLTRYHPLGSLLDEMNRMQEEFAKAIGRPPPRGSSAGGGFPAVNVWEDEHAFHAETDLPGVDPARLEVFVAEGNQLTLQGERTPPEVKGAAWVRQERPFGRFARVIALLTVVDADKVEARYEHGVLRLTLPKSEAAKPRRIAVTAGD